MRPPSMRCTEPHEGGLLFHFSRAQVCPLQCGIIKPATPDQYRIRAVVEPVGKHNSSVPVALTKETDWQNAMSRQRSASLVAHLSRFTASTRPHDLHLSVATFCSAFPFHLMFNRSLQIVQSGIALLRLLRSCDVNSFMFADYFTVVAPDMTFSFNAVLSCINAVFVITTNSDALRLSPSNRRCADGEVDAAQTLTLKGEMVYVRECDCVLFLCSPQVTTLDFLASKGLYLSDFPLHDATRDLILMTHARRAEQELIEKLEETSRDLRKLEVRLNEDKQRTECLLHSILPSKVAARLRLNKPVEAEKYDVVTVLFADIVQFTTMCGNKLIEAMDIVRVLNKLYTQFDMLSTLNQVYKVSTPQRLSSSSSSSSSSPSSSSSSSSSS